jgi:hypothetical protein
MVAAASLARGERIGLFSSKIRGRLRAMRNFWLAAVATLAACSNEPIPPADVRLSVGQESDTWSAEPAPTLVQIDLVEGAKRTKLGEAPAPATVVTLHNPGIAPGTIAAFEATGIDASGTPIVRGASVPYILYDLDTATIPIFVGRASTFGRPAENMEHGRNHPVAVVAWHQYVLSAGGEVTDFSPAVPDVYDTINWQALTKQPPFPRAPKTMVLVGDSLLCIDDAGATWINLYNDRVAQETAPAGLTFAEVAGGDVFELADGTSYVVGSTRTGGEPTTKVLRVDTNGLLRAVALATPRRGAAAGVVAGNLVVWGGSAEGAGAETLNKIQDAFVALPFAPDPTTGLGLGTLDGNTALLAGGKDPVTGNPVAFRTFDVTCTADCAASELTMAPAFALQRTHVFSLAAGHLLVTGDDDSGEFHALSVLTTSGTPEVVERPMRERRLAATSVLLPNGQPAVLGGQNPETMAPVLSLESFFF